MCAPVWAPITGPDWPWIIGIGLAGAAIVVGAGLYLMRRERHYRDSVH